MQARGQTAGSLVCCEVHARRKDWTRGGERSDYRLWCGPQIRVEVRHRDNTAACFVIVVLMYIYLIITVIQFGGDILTPDPWRVC
jgi:hypothetical protein